MSALFGIGEVYGHVTQFTQGGRLLEATRAHIVRTVVCLLLTRYTPKKGEFGELGGLRVHSG